MNRPLIKRRLNFLFAVSLAVLFAFGIVGGNTARAATASIGPGSQTACVGQNVRWTLHGGTLAPFDYSFTWGDGKGGQNTFTSLTSVPAGPHSFSNTQTYGQYLVVTDGNNTTANAQSSVTINCFAPR